MIVYEDLQDAIYDFVSTAIGSVPAIWADNNGPAPDDATYVTMRINGLSRVAQDYTSPPDETTLDRNITGNREFMLMLQSIGPGSIQLLETIRCELQKFSVLESLRADGLVYVDEESIQNITQLDDSKFVERGALDIRFRLASITTTDDGAIEKTTIGTQYKKGDTVVLTDTLEINH